jgi:tetratricopeptide (TPR) repeat protein
VNITKRQYQDSNPPSGKYYYALVPGNYAKNKEYSLTEGVNITADPVTTGKFVTVQEDAGDGEQKEDSSNIDRVLNQTFFMGRYAAAITRLEQFIRSSESEYEIAKAKLFIGRSFIEQGRYIKALDYLLLPDVMRNFRNESRFWKNFALTRVR